MNAFFIISVYIYAMIKEVDYIVVGCGLAGVAFCEKLIANQKSFIVFDDMSQMSSVVAGGLYNPVVLKRFTPVWLSTKQLDIAHPFYKRLENKLGIKLDYRSPVLRRFTSSEEQNNWFTAADNPKLSKYMSLEILQNNNEAINAPFGFGKVLHSGRVDTNTLINKYRLFLKSLNKLADSSFYYNDLKIIVNGFSYRNIKAKHIVFSEGFGVKRNPYFNMLPLNGTKGELITIYSPQLKLESIIKSGVFIIPLGEDMYRVGATYEWKDKTNLVTEEAKSELVSKLASILNCDYKIIHHVAGIRPTVIDRRPLVGRNSSYKNMYILNGLGTRGVMIAPYAATQLYNYIENDEPLNEEIDINRFTKTSPA